MAEIRYVDDVNRIMRCIICTEQYTNLESHLRVRHPSLPLTDYLRAVPGNIESDVTVVEVPEAEVLAHPGGRDGAAIEATLRTDKEKPIYRQMCADLRAEGYAKSYTLAAAAYQLLLAARLRARIEDETRQGVFNSDAAYVQQLATIEGRYREYHKDLRSMRRDLVVEGDDPLAVVEAELREAEQWVVASQGEFQEQCPRCGQMLTAPALPHWAYEPIRLRDDTLIWPVWSRELWTLVLGGQLALWQMAYVLRTSPEGLRVTATRRGESWPDTIDLVQEERQLRETLNREDRAAVMADRPLLPERRLGAPSA